MEQSPVEKIGQNPGFGIVSRFRFENQRPISLLQADLPPGHGALFLADDTKIDFRQSEMVEALEEAARRENFETMALVDITTGSLLFTLGSADQSIGINRQIPYNQRVQVATLHETLQYGLIWGENQQEAYEHLRQLQRLRMSRN